MGLYLEDLKILDIYYHNTCTKQFTIRPKDAQVLIETHKDAQ